MERQKPDSTSNEIALYIRTYYSLLRSSGYVRVRSFEEAHSFSHSSLHSDSRSERPDVGAFAYAAARLPELLPFVSRIVLGQSDVIFRRFGYDVARWSPLGARGRRRLLRYDGDGTLAVYVASSSDIDDMVPMVTAYQLEWNKMHGLLRRTSAAAGCDASLAEALHVTEAEVARLRAALGERHEDSLRELARSKLDLRIRLLAGSFTEYQAAAQLWWDGIEAAVQPPTRSTPTYFVSSNMHALSNLLGGFALAHSDELGAKRAPCLRDRGAVAGCDDPEASAPELYYALRNELERDPRMRSRVSEWDARSGIRSVEHDAHVEVSAQIVELSKLRPELFDPRVRVDGVEMLARSDARILNIDYPLGMAAYHLLSRVGQGVSPLLGVYVMGKAATLNAQVGDVLISRAVHDEHSENTYLFSNAFSAEDVAPALYEGSVLDNQKAVTCRGPFLQNESYLGVFYREGYTVLEMEAGPYLSAIYELVDPRRHPRDQVVNLCERAGFDVGILHYASDTPYSRRQSLLSKSLGESGMDSTYACAIAITRRILSQEVARMARPPSRPHPSENPNTF